MVQILTQQILQMFISFFFFTKSTLFLKTLQKRELIKMTALLSIITSIINQ